MLNSNYSLRSMDWNGTSETVENGFRCLDGNGFTWLKPGANEMESIQGL
jgi:hypothetical protein